VREKGEKFAASEIPEHFPENNQLLERAYCWTDGGGNIGKGGGAQGNYGKYNRLRATG